MVVTHKPVSGIKAISPTGHPLQFPLHHTEVTGKISGNLARIEVRQQFTNPYNFPLEAIYIFPLSDESAVDQMEMKIGEHIIKGTVKKREEAQHLYQTAKQQGKTAGLLEQERDNIFTQSIANIKPHENIEVIIRYSESIKFEAGHYQFVFPMVVGPRFIPGEDIGEGNTDQVPDANRITPPVLPPESRSGHDIRLTLDIHAGVPLTYLNSSSHKIEIYPQENHTQIQLHNSDTIPNKDFIFNYSLLGENTATTLLKHNDQRGLHFALYFIPAIEYSPKEIIPKDVIFLMDTSGSQMGYPLLQSKALMKHFIEGLNPDDTFTIIDFANVTTQLSSSPLENTSANRQKAFRYIEKLKADGGTYLLHGIKKVLSFPPARNGRLRSIVLITDGYIGNDNEVIAEVQEKLQKGNRLYSFGVGSSVNRYVLNRLAEVGRGTVHIIRHDEDPDPVVQHFFKQINQPVLMNIETTWLGEGESPLVYPTLIPDLFANQPLVLFGRTEQLSTGSLQVKGVTAGGEVYQRVFNLSKLPSENNPAIAQLWGRKRIKSLMDEMYGYETKEGVNLVTETALSYQLLSQYTAFIVISEENRVDANQPYITMNVPVEIPEGVDYFSSVSGSAVRGISFPAPAPMVAMSQITDDECLFISSDNDLGNLVDRIIRPRMRPTYPEKKQKNEAKSLTIKIIRAEGVDQKTVDELEQYLNSQELKKIYSGEITLELQLEKGRIKQVIVDTVNSTLLDTVLIKVLRHILLRWQGNFGLLDQVVITFAF